MAAKGRFIPKNPQKYVGRSINQIFFRSSWELAFLKWLDSNDAVLRWGSEELRIPYIHPADGRVHQYYPDMIVMYMDAAGQIKKEIIEIKPYKESVETPRMSERDAAALAVNKAKWKFAADWAERNGAKFRILTERQLFLSPNGLNKPRKKLGTAV